MQNGQIKKTVNDVKNNDTIIKKDFKMFHLEFKRVKRFLMV